LSEFILAVGELEDDDDDDGTEAVEWAEVDNDWDSLC
jgi:hypothetical protein